MTRKRFVKLLMGRLLLTRNEANYVADVVRIGDLLECRARKGQVKPEAEITTKKE